MTQSSRKFCQLSLGESPLECPGRAPHAFCSWIVFILQEMSGLPEVEMESLGESAFLPRNSPMEPFQQASLCVIIWLFSLMM